MDAIFVDGIYFNYPPFFSSQGNVRDVTEGSHDITANRDMRDALGALGPVDGLNPELSNLTCSITEVGNRYCTNHFVVQEHVQ